jgi:hypothetical protein
MHFEEKSIFWRRRSVYLFLTHIYRRGALGGVLRHVKSIPPTGARLGGHSVFSFFLVWCLVFSVYFLVCVALVRKFSKTTHIALLFENYFSAGEI